ncbi:MAG: hypothetical protein ACOCQT_00105 [Desulfovermiculus sp.]
MKQINNELCHVEIDSTGHVESFTGRVNVTLHFLDGPLAGGLYKIEIDPRDLEIDEAGDGGEL